MALPFPTDPPFKYSVKRTVKQRSIAHKFYDMSEQRNAQGKFITHLEFTWAKIPGEKKTILQSFYDSQEGETNPFSVELDHISYGFCRFVGDSFQADQISHDIWNVKLQVNVSSDIPPVFLKNEMDFIRQQSYGVVTPGYAITRTPIGDVHAYQAQGTWTVPGYAPPTYPVATIDGSPSPSYTGNLTGTLSQPLSGGQTLVIYSVTDQAYEQITLTVTGTTWSLSFANTGIKLAVVFDAAGNVISTSELYPKTFDPNFQINTYLVTDAEYLQLATAANTDGTWIIPPSFVDYLQPVSDHSTIPLLVAPNLTGVTPPYLYTVKLLSRPAEVILCTTVVLDGLVRSYEIPVSDPNYSILHNRCYLYDQAISIIASLAFDDTVETDRLVSGLIHAQSTASGTVGQWFFSVDAYTASPPDPYFRCGAQAYCIYALCLYLHVRGSSQYGSQVTDAINAGITALLVFQNTSGPLIGLVSLGAGSYSGNTFQPNDTNAVVGNASTEHNSDSYFALQAANVIVPGMGYDTARDAVANGMKTALWGKAIYGTATFLEGMAVDGTEDTAGALDINFLGCFFWQAQGNEANAVLSLSACAAFRFILTLGKGYAPYVPFEGYPGALPNVWPEGTEGVALATLRTQGVESFNDVMQGIVELRNQDGGWNYCEVVDDTYELQTWEGISGTAWAIIVLSPVLQSLMFVPI